MFYAKLDADGGWPEFEKLYEAFVREVIFPLFEDDTLIYQSIKSNIGHVSSMTLPNFFHIQARHHFPCQLIRNLMLPRQGKNALSRGANNR